MPKNAIDSDSFTPLSKQTPLFSRLGACLLTIGMVLAFFISQLLGVYAAGKFVLPSTKSSTIADIFFFGGNDGTVISYSIIIGCVLLIAISVLIIRLRGGNSRQYLALKPFAFSTGMKMLGLLILFMIGSQVLTYFLDETPLVFVDPLYQSVSSVRLLVFAMVIVAPLYEELVFRGILWSALSEQFATSQSRHHGAIVASLVTSLIFAVIHVQYGIYEISTIVVLALLFCYARIKSGSLLLPMLMHMINNGVAMGQYIAQTA